jgi:hypothetical protein
MEGKYFCFVMSAVNFTVTQPESYRSNTAADGLQNKTTIK